MVEMADDRWLSAESALRSIKAVLVAALRVDPCPWCNDEGIVHTHDGEIIGPCECARIDGQADG